VNIFLKSFLFLFFVSISFPQETSRTTLFDGNSVSYIPSYNFNGNPYISVKYFVSALELPNKVDEVTKSIKVDFNNYSARFIAKNPFLVLNSKSENRTSSVQLVTSAHFIDGLIFIPLKEMLEINNRFNDRAVIYASPNRLIVVNPDKEQINTIQTADIEVNELGTFVKLKAADKIKSIYNDESKTSFIVSLFNTIDKSGEISNVEPDGLVKHISVENIDGNLELNILKTNQNVAAEIFQIKNEEELVIHFFSREDSYWLEKESKHFKIIYRPFHSHLINDVLISAERALEPLMALFEYYPSEKIIINTYDVSDYGFSTTTTVPQNYIRLEIEPLEPGYEVVPYNDRIQWLLSHELVHIIVNDSRTSIEGFFRKIFGKVPPDKIQPTTVFYSLLTNFNRYSPRWHQEAIAVYIETWFSGGYGRLLGSFDEMYFRTLVSEGNDFPSQLDIETLGSHNSMFLENLFYIYGGRLVGYLSIVYGTDKVINWFKTSSNDFYSGFEGKFESVFEKEFNQAWKEFIEFEKLFQRGNIELLSQQEFTGTKKIGKNKFGWVTSPQLDKRSGEIIFGYHRPHELASMQSLKLKTGSSKTLTSLPTPSMLQVASTAYDEVHGLLFFTTNNNQLFRDIWVYDVDTDDQKMLFENARVGDLTVNSKTHDLWGVEHDRGTATLIVSPFPYREIIRLVGLPKGDEIFNLEIDDAGENIAAILKKPSGQQSLIIFNANCLMKI
jgi:hypothetical protein